MNDNKLFNDPASELLEANKQLKYLIEEKEKRASELLIANKELEFQNQEKETRSSELLKAIEDLKISEKKLLESNKELEAFSYSVSHDLRAPLRAIGSYSQMLEEDYHDLFDENGRRLLKTIQFSAVKMGTLIDNLLSFSRLGKKELRKNMIRMNEFIQNIIDEFTLIYPNHAKIIVQPLPDAYADEEMLSNVIINLLSNAVKYSFKNEFPCIEISGSEKNGEIVYCVNDNGIGFDNKYENKLFGVFQRLHSEKEYQGTGVGLAIAKRIIEKHDGKIWAASEEGKGASFYFALPSKI